MDKFCWDQHYISFRNCIAHNTDHHNEGHRKTTWQDFMMLRSVSETERLKTGRQIPTRGEGSFEISPGDC